MRKSKVLFLIVFVAIFMLVIDVHAQTSGSTAKDVNPAFTDDAFAFCVLDAYNSANGTTKVSLTNEELETIDNLDCSNKGINNIDGINLLTGLRYLDIDYNNLNVLDFGDHAFSVQCSGGLCRPTLSFDHNPLKQTIDMIVGDNKQFSDSVKLVEENSKYMTEIVYKSSDDTIATVDEKGLIKALKVGTVNITKTYTYADGYDANEVEVVETNVIKITEKEPTKDTTTTNNANKNGNQTVEVGDTLKRAYIGYCIGAVILVLGVMVLVQTYRKNKKENID